MQLYIKRFRLSIPGQIDHPNLNEQVQKVRRHCQNLKDMLDLSLQISYVYQVKSQL